MKFKGADILTTKQFDKVGMVQLFRRALEMEKVIDGQRGVDGDGGEWGKRKVAKKGKDKAGFSKLLDGKVLATLFFEPSTRTRFSFETAFLRLGGKVVSGADMTGTSSIKKKETLYDTGRVVSELVDLIVMRHPEPFSVNELARGVRDGGGKRTRGVEGEEQARGADGVDAVVPVINAGDGANQHPTQALLDVYTMWKEAGGKLDGLTIGMIGDLKNGRVPHSQCDLLKNWNVNFVFVSPKALKMPWEVKDDLAVAGREFYETEDLEEAIGVMDVICATRIQEERFNSAKEAAKYRGVYVIDAGVMKKAKKKAVLLHPLPRVDEIAVEVDVDGRARYFDQVANGLAIRMALMAMLMGK